MKIELSKVNAVKDKCRSAHAIFLTYNVKLTCREFLTNTFPGKSLYIPFYYIIVRKKYS